VNLGGDCRGAMVAAFSAGSSVKLRLAKIMNASICLIGLSLVGCAKKDTPLPVHTPAKHV
jgi:hypothetical protein